MARTVTAPHTDRRYWRKLLRLAYPDAGGDDDLFVWVRNLQEHVAGDTVEPVPREARSQPPRHHTSTSNTGDRIDFTAAFVLAADHDDLTHRAVALTADMGQPYEDLLLLLMDCYEAPEHDIALSRQQNQGTTYKSLAAIAYAVGMGKPQRVEWYRIAESVPLSQRMAGHLLSKLRR